MIYFDNAATTYPKPADVISSVVECMQDYCGNPGRGSHFFAKSSAEKVFMAREAVGEFFNASPENVIFTLNTTYALNMAIKGVMHSGGHMLISNMEHNSVLRPVSELSRAKKISYNIFDGYGKDGSLTSKEILSDILSKLRRDTKMLVCIHSSNICSHTMPIREIGKLCRRHGILFCVDAAQSAGILPINMEEDCIDLLCLPGHKGLLAPQGIGILVLRQGLTLDTLIEGGNGINSLAQDMGRESPERYEGGTICTPAAVGLYAGLQFIQNYGLHTISRHHCFLWKEAASLLNSSPRIIIHDNTPGSVLLFSIDGLQADEVGRMLDRRGFCLRTGYHCAALAHRTLNTPVGGAVRIGFGIFNTEAQTEALCQAIIDIAKQ